METDRSIVDMGKETLYYQAKDLGYDVYSYDEEQRKVRLTRGTTRVDLWLTKKSTVAVMQKGKPAVYHRYVTEAKLQEILSEA